MIDATINHFLPMAIGQEPKDTVLKVMALVVSMGLVSVKLGHHQNFKLHLIHMKQIVIMLWLKPHILKECKLAWRMVVYDL